ncbi:MAG: hypothetical protein M3P37_08540, partial [Actinomycetota bacterium]|nr:hypothetical protein [Actinomycetota bacterium]
RAGARALARWQSEEPDMVDVPSLVALVEVLSERHRPQRQDALMSALLRQSRRYRDARRVVLKALTPALVKISCSHSRVMNSEDAASVVVLAAMERLTNYTASRPGRPAANVVKTSATPCTGPACGRSRDLSISPSSCPSRTSIWSASNPPSRRPARTCCGFSRRRSRAGSSPVRAAV